MGVPVKLIWSREEDVRQGYLHSVSAQYLKAAQDENGKTTAWLHRSVFPTIMSTFSAEANRPANANQANQSAIQPVVGATTNWR